MSTGDYDDVIADNLKNIETELSNLTENQKVRLDRRFKDLNIGIIGMNNQLNNINKNAYDVGLSYWTNFKKVSKYKKELSENVEYTEKQMISNIGAMLKKSFGADNMIVQGQKMPNKKEVN